MAVTNSCTRPRGGRYFAVHMTQWQGERDTIEPLGKEAANYETLTEHDVEYEDAFGEPPEEA